MKGRLFLIHWDAAEAEERADRLRAAGWEVETEAEDGADAAERIRADLPAAVVVSLARLPSHGRETSHYLRSRYGESELPIVFVDGTEDKVEAARERVPEAVFTVSDELPAVLQELTRLRS
jgi:CheY-like chemotaxis protein